MANEHTEPALQLVEAIRTPGERYAEISERKAAHAELLREVVTIALSACRPR